MNYGIIRGGYSYYMRIPCIGETIPHFENEEVVQGHEARGPKRKNSFLRERTTLVPQFQSSPDNYPISGTGWHNPSPGELIYEFSSDIMCYASYRDVQDLGWTRIPSFSGICSFKGTGPADGTNATFVLKDGVLISSTGYWCYQGQDPIPAEDRVLVWGWNWVASHYIGTYQYQLPDPLPYGQLDNYWKVIHERHAPAPGAEWSLFKDACQAVRADSNNIANVQQVIDIIKTLSSKSPKVIIKETLEDISSTELRKNIGNAWLQYRYAYTTTRSDVEMHLELAKTLNQLSNSSYVTSHSSITDDRGTFSLSMDLQDREVKTLKGFTQMVKDMGLFPTASNIWDMIPFSFIIDWFGSIGDWAEFYSTKYLEDWECFDISNIMLASRYEETIAHGDWLITFSCYRRNFIDPPSYSYYIDDASTSGSTVMKRIFDAGSLLVGLT